MLENRLMDKARELYLYNTLSGKKEKFAPIDEDNVRMYACGPTVYNFAHLGNARAATTYDILFRALKMVYGDDKVTYVSNITDVDDKIINRAKEKGLTIYELSAEFIDRYHEDMQSINNLKPTKEPRATDNIDEMLNMIQALIDNGHAYVSSGHVLFDVMSYKDYGSLSNRSLEEMVSGSRVEIAGYKRNPLDFVLWKPANEDDDLSSIFNSPWSRGRPGWHIECSAMSVRYLGENYDIHGGGVDLKFPHHENEIAQSVCACKGSKYANYWIHNGFLMVNGEKMSKSLGNFMTIRELIDRDIPGVAIRYVLLSSHYRKPVDFSDKMLSDAEIALEKMHKIINDDLMRDLDESEKKGVKGSLLDALCDDMNTPIALSFLHKLRHEKKGVELKYAMELLGLYDKDFLNRRNELGSKEELLKQVNLTTEEIEGLIKERNEAKKNRNWIKADKIRDDLLEKGIVLKDSKDGTSWDISF